MRLPKFLIADGTPLSLGSVAAGTGALTVAADDDWLEVLEMARRNISNGSMQVAAGETWEEALCNNAARLLHAGIHGSEWPAMGRTPDDAGWVLQQARWIELVFAVAALGSSHMRRLHNDDGSPVFPPTHVLSGTVFTCVGRVSLTEIFRSERES